MALQFDYTHDMLRSSRIYVPEIGLANHTAGTGPEPIDH
jgi:hypothetical protein